MVVDILFKLITKPHVRNVRTTYAYFMGTQPAVLPAAQAIIKMASTSTAGPQSVELSQLPLPQLDSLKAQLDEVL